MNWREEIIGDARLILADCMEVLPTLPEFAELCRQSALGRTQQAPALLAPRTDQETARRKVAEMIAALAKKCETPTR